MLGGNYYWHHQWKHWMLGIINLLFTDILEAALLIVLFTAADETVIFKEHTLPVGVRNTCLETINQES